jgi:hypothetical protein
LRVWKIVQMLWRLFVEQQSFIPYKISGQFPARSSFFYFVFSAVFMHGRINMQAIIILINYSSVDSRRFAIISNKHYP